jgi:hypothetical protein
MSNIEKLKKWVVSGAAKPPEGETVETIIRHIETTSKPQERRKQS